MNRKRLGIFGLSVLVLLTGCTTTLSKSRIEAVKDADYGSPLTLDYETFIKDYFEQILFDPYSAVYEFRNPQRVIYKPGMWEGGGQLTKKLYVGYVVIALVNAKNRLGAYVGAERYGFLFKDDKLVTVLRDFNSGAVYLPDSDSLIQQGNVFERVLSPQFPAPARIKHIRPNENSSN